MCISNAKLNYNVMLRGMPDPAAPAVGKRLYYLHLWREFAALHTRASTAKRAVTFAVSVSSLTHS